MTELQAQLSTLEEDTFAATQSDSCGRRGTGRRVRRRRQRHVRAREGPLHRAERARPPAEDRAARSSASTRARTACATAAASPSRRRASRRCLTSTSASRTRRRSRAASRRVDRVGRAGSRPLLLFATAAVAYSLDRRHEALGRAHVCPATRSTSSRASLTLRYTTNSGGAFSLGQRAPWLFVGATVVVVGVILVGWRFRHRAGCSAVALGLVLGGALGNLTDRVDPGPGPARAGRRLRRPPRVAGVQPGGQRHRDGGLLIGWRRPSGGGPAPDAPGGRRP